MNSEKLKQRSEHISVTGESLTKLALNNKIVEMRKNVRQSRVQCINKLIKEIRRLKIKKGNEEQISRNLKKVDRLTEQMAVMKKVNPDVVSKFALQNEKSLVEITNDMNEPVERKALARLGCHKSVHQKVLEFREKFPDWRKSLILFLESLGEKYKNRKPTPIVSKKKEKKSNSLRKNENSVYEENLRIPNTSRVASIRSSSGLWTVAACDSENANSKDGESEDTNAKTDSNPLQSPVLGSASNLDEFSVSDSDSKENQLEKFSDAQKSKSKTKKPQVFDGNVKTDFSPETFSKEDISNKLSCLVPQNNSNEFDSRSNLKELQVSNRNVGTESPVGNAPKKVMKTESTSASLKSDETNKLPKNMSNLIPEVAADPFFITCDNKEYLSISAKPIGDMKESLDDQKESKRMILQSKSERFSSNSKQFKLKSNQNNSLGKRKKFESTREKPSDTIGVSATTSLHPSWLAKKKQSTIIQNSQFQGKKIKFDD